MTIVRIMQWYLVAAALALWPLWLCAADEDGVSMETKYLALKISREGRVVEVRDKIHEKSYLLEGGSTPFMRVQTAEKAYDISSIGLKDGLLTASFDDSGISASFKLDVRDDFFTIEVVSISGGSIKYLEFVRLPVALTETIASQTNAASNADFAVSVMAATPPTNALMLGRIKDHVLLGARCWPEVDTRDVRAVVFGCDTRSLKSTIEKVELACSLPHLTFNGVWAKDSPETRKGYLLTNPTGGDVEKAIAYAKRGGIPYVMFLSSAWSTSLGHYPINTKNFPKGEEDLKATVDKIHAEGMKAGMHFLSACISKSDAYVTPISDKRLDKDGELTLARDIDEKTDFVPTTEDPQGFLTEAHYGTRGGVDIQIGDEIIHYAGISHEQPFGFARCKRGFYKTGASAHKAGEKVYHINQRYNMFLADPKTDLVDEIAERLAHVYNTCGFDMVYFDGGEAMAATGPSWYTVSLVHRAFNKRAKREILWQGSGSTHYSWHFFCRGNCDDYACLDPKAYCDQHKTPRIQNYYKANFLRADLGWWGYLTHESSYYATLPDDIEYMCAKAVGWDASINLECHISSLDKNGRTGETLDRMKIWQDLQHSDSFSEATKERLRQPEMDFTLVQDENARWRVQPVKHHPDQIVDPKIAETKSWRIRSEMADTPIAARIRALTELAPYGAEGNIVLFDPVRNEDLTGSAADSGVTIKGEISAEQVKTGQSSCKVAVKCGEKARNEWAMIERKFKQPLNLSAHRALGIWVYGDGKGELLNIQIEDAGHSLRDHYVDVDFTGWRYFTLDNPEARRVWDYRWPYNQKGALRSFSFKAVRAVNLYITNVKPGETATVFIGKIEALKETPTNMKNPTLAVGDKSITIPAELKPDEYVEFDSQGRCRHFDPNGHLLSEPGPILRGGETPPVAVSGENTISFSSDSNARARVTVMVKGELLQ